MTKTEQHQDFQQPQQRQHKRSPSVTKTHQRKSSITSASTHHRIPDKSTQASTSLASLSTFNMSRSWQKYTSRLSLQLDAFLNPSGPLLPHEQQGTSKSWVAMLTRSRLARLLLLFYAMFSVMLSFSQFWGWYFSSTPPLDPRFGVAWQPVRTYDSDQSYSVMDNMTTGLKMSKLFSKSHYEAVRMTEPYWLKRSEAIDPRDVTLTTAVTLDTWAELERIAERWQGPISATLHIDHQVGRDQLQRIRDAYTTGRVNNLKLRADIHLVRSTESNPPTVLLSRNVERNVARLFARTEFVCEMPSNLVPATDLRRTFDANRKIFETLLREGDMLVVPIFGFNHQSEREAFTIPYHKARLLESIDKQEMGLVDPHWEINQGPTDLDRWRESTSLYAVEHYHYDYEPIVITSKTVQPWCAERFLDRRSACLLSNYLAGGEFWVLPDDFVVQLPASEESQLSDFERVIENRVYAKFYWEQCVHHARQLDALGLWKNARSEHVRKQCSRVIQNWGKGLIGKPE
ncbi:glycosyltransferase family 49 protein [Lichtheimia corymbifera JMRC:FSU:9682]|uniref:Glycosyltransferase family 49 protein n=1 Tax=Lichtheimia corymbifera JMRC:FSU:9682 TaxID=1263082 RepID=A0A068RZ77_9FUNG|nr:glycosyltransferase family 49 protein [Lichtheimia corymbifera JMRC:FSU:9682]